MAQFKNTRELLEAWPGLDDDVRAALLSAISTRGKNKGYLLANSPATDAGAKYVAWQALVGELAPVRASVWGLMFLRANDKALYDRLVKVLELGLGFAVRAYEPGFRWSLFANRYNVEALRTHYHAVATKETNHV